MTEQELRALVREAIRRHVAEGPAAAATHGASRDAGPHARSAPMRVAASGRILLDPAHAMFPLPEGDGPCLIEPAVPCTHCGFCKSFGH